MPRRVVCTTGLRLAAGKAEEGSGGLGLCLDDRAGPVGGDGVVAGFIQPVERRPDLEAEDLIRPAGLAAANDDRRPVLLCENRPFHAGLSEDERPRRRLHRSPSSSKVARP